MAARKAGPELNIVPSATGAARAVGLVIPQLKGKFTSTSDPLGQRHG